MVNKRISRLIKILSGEDLSETAQNPQTIPYDIEAKISYNNLIAIRDLIGAGNLCSQFRDNLTVDLHGPGFDQLIRFTT